MVYVLDVNGRPLMPTKRHGKVRHLLKDKQAKIINYRPFTIQLLYKSTTYIQPLYGGTDPGRDNIGNAVICCNDNAIESIYTDHVTTRNKEISKFMQERKAQRQASRRGERKRRQRRAKKCGQSFGTKERILPGCDKPIILHDIINTESRFNNRKRPDGWITPTVRQLVQTHLNQIDHLCSIMPITDWTFELNQFAFMKLEDSTIYGVDYQNGKLKDYASVDDYIYDQQDGKCIFCGKPIKHYHHIVPRSKGGSDRPENKVGLCEHHHDLVHKDEKWSKKLAGLGEKKKYAALSIVNQAIPFIYQGLVDRFGESHVHIIAGWQTKHIRVELKLPKEHWCDAISIAAMPVFEYGQSVHQKSVVYEIKQFRRHDRSLIKSQTERTYKLDGKIVAKNRRKRMEQKTYSLHDFYLEQKALHGKKKAKQIMDQLIVVKSMRRYNDPNRLMPGTVFLYKGKRYVMSGQLTGGKYLRAVGDTKTNYPRSKCHIVSRNGGLVYL